MWFFLGLAGLNTENNNNGEVAIAVMVNIVIYHDLAGLVSLFLSTSAPPEVIGGRSFGGIRSCFCSNGFVIRHLFQIKFLASRYRNIKFLLSQYFGP